MPSFALRRTEHHCLPVTERPFFWLHCTLVNQNYSDTQTWVRLDLQCWKEVPAPWLATGKSRSWHLQSTTIGSITLTANWRKPKEGFGYRYFVNGWQKCILALKPATKAVKQQDKTLGLKVSPGNRIASGPVGRNIAKLKEAIMSLVHKDLSYESAMDFPLALLNITVLFLSLLCGRQSPGALFILLS